MGRRLILIVALILGSMGASAGAADLQPRTVAAFDRYVRVTEAQMAADPFLRLDGLPEAECTARLAELRRGEVWMDRLVTRDGGKSIDVPDGLIHHWVGAVLIPNATL